MKLLCLAGLSLEFSTQPSNPSYVPYFMSAFSEKMSFTERVQNFVLKLGITIGTLVHFYSKSCSSLEIASVTALQV